MGDNWKDNVNDSARSFIDDIKLKDIPGALWSDLGDITTINNGGAANPLSAILYLGNGIVIAEDCLRALYRSTDYGLTWTCLGTIHRGTGAGVARVNCGNGLAVIVDHMGEEWRTWDYGKTWEFVMSVDGGNYVGAFVYCGGGVIVAGLWGGSAGHVFRSTNYGTTWTDLGDISGGSGGSANYGAYLGNGIVIFTDDNGHVFRSADHGLTWADLGDITGLNLWLEGTISLNNGIALTTAHDGADGHVYRSTDWGLTWTDLGAVIAGESINPFCYLGRGVVVGGCNLGSIYRSTDYGLTWELIGLISADYIWDMAYCDGIILFCDQDGHIFRSDTSRGIV